MSVPLARAATADKATKTSGFCFSTGSLGQVVERIVANLKDSSQCDVTVSIKFIPSASLCDVTVSIQFVPSAILCDVTVGTQRAPGLDSE